jgi:hypothetical protein
MILFTTLVAFALNGATFSEKPADAKRPTAREVYVGCFLMTYRDDHGGSPDEYFFRFGAGACQATALAAGFASIPPPKGPGSWCPPLSEDISVENLQPMVSTFLEYFEKNSSKVSDIDGEEVFLDAMRERWPCRK